MGCVASAPRKHFVQVVGPSLGGKTTLINSLLPKENRKEQGEVSPTVGISVVTLNTAGESFVLYDHSGKAEARRLWNDMSGRCGGAIFVADPRQSTSENLSALQYYMSLSFGSSSFMNRDEHGNIAETPILIVINEEGSSGQAVSELERLLKEAVHNRQFLITRWGPTSTGKHLNKGLQWLTKNMV